MPRDLPGRLEPGPGDALIVTDVQRDFLPGGRLAVPHADEILPLCNDCLARFSALGLPVFATRDWHPPGHCSFRERGGPWPEHCVQGSPGAGFSDELRLPPDAEVVSKATDPDAEAYSSFQGTGLAERLRARGVRRLFVTGLATDYCVLNTVLDAVREGFAAVVLTQACRGVDVRSGDSERALRAMAAAGARLVGGAADFDACSSPLLVDLYELTMAQAYLDEGLLEPAAFELFVRRLPPGRNFLMAAGLEQALDFLEDLRFSSAELSWLAGTGRFSPRLLDYLAGLRFTGDVWALAEGTVFFAEEPALRVSAPLPLAQLVESRLMNLLQLQTLVASKAARCVLAAPGRTLVDFGLRRAQGGEAGLFGARASYLAGFSGSSDLLAEARFGIPSFGTMAHSFIQAHDSEEEAFTAFCLAHPGQTVLLLDTYDTEAAARKVVALAPGLRRRGIRIQAVRLDSGDLVELSRRVRRILDAGGLSGVRIFASGGLDERALRDALRAGAPIDAFGVGSRLGTSDDAPYLDCAYKLVEYAGRPRWKSSPGKVTRPGRKQVFRRRDAAGRLREDRLGLEGEDLPGERLLVPVMRDGRRLSRPALAELRRRAQGELAGLPAALRSLEMVPAYPVRLSELLSASPRPLVPG